MTSVFHSLIAKNETPTVTKEKKAKSAKCEFAILQKEANIIPIYLSVGWVEHEDKRLSEKGFQFLFNSIEYY
jgi:hypothetical protein